MDSRIYEPASAVSTVKYGEYFQFRLAYGADATAETDPVALAYKAGAVGHLTTLLELTRAALSPGDRVLDLGAHLGGYTLSAAALGCEVLAVEGSPRNVDLLEQSIALNKYTNARVENACVSDKPGLIQFCSSGPFGHVASAATHMPSVAMPAIRIDDLVRERGWTNIRLIKLDIEGSEIRAIRGMEQLLRKQSPLVYFESNKHALGFYDFTPEMLKNEMRQRGYTVYAIEPGKLTPVPRSEVQTEDIVDYLAAKKLPPQIARWAGPTMGDRIGESLRHNFRRAANLALRLSRAPGKLVRMAKKK